MVLSAAVHAYDVFALRQQQHLVRLLRMHYRQSEVCDWGLGARLEDARWKVEVPKEGQGGSRRQRAEGVTESNRNLGHT